jgi:hypothetical protein
MVIEYRTKNFARKRFDRVQPAHKDAVLREMANQKKNLAEKFHEREILRRDIAKLREKINAPLINLLSADEKTINALNEQMNKMRIKRTLPKREPSEVPRRKRVPFGFGTSGECPDFLVRNPWDFEWRYANILGKPNIDLVADKSSGHMVLSAYSEFGAFADASAASVGTMLGFFFSPSPDKSGQLFLWGDPVFSYGWYIMVDWFKSASSAAWVGIQVDSYTLDNKFDRTIVDNRTSLWYHDITYGWSSISDGGNSDGYFAADLDVDIDHWYAVWVTFEAIITADSTASYFTAWADSGAGLSCTFPWVVGQFCPD